MYIGESKISKMEGGGVATSWVSEEHTKIENLERILCNEIPKDKKILIFSEHEGNFDCYTKAFAKSGRNSLSAVKGSISHITNLLGKFNSGEIPCLFLNAKYCGSGLNLEKTDIVIIMHKMTQDNIKQVIGRAQRIGRQGQLEVFFLYAENE
jgi:SNF2 family DNA or RNA helicase